MRHVLLTCKQHPKLRWNCKSLAFTPGRGYNQQRRIFFLGEKQSDGRTLEVIQEGFENYRCVFECKCPATDLVIAPEDPWGGLSEDDQRKAIEEDCK